MFQYTEPKRDRPYYTQTPPPKKVRLSPDEQIHYVTESIRKGVLPSDIKITNEIFGIIVSYEQKKLLYSHRIKDINKQDASGNTILHHIENNNDVKILNMLLGQYGDRMDLNITNNKGETVLDRVLNSRPRRAKDKLIHILKRHKALAKCHASFHEACRKGSINDIKYYVSAGIVNINYLYNEKTSLMDAMENSHADTIVEYLIYNGADVNQINKKGENILHFVSYHFNIERLLRFMIAYPPTELNLISKDYETPLDAMYRRAADETNSLYDKNIDTMKRYNFKCYSHDENGLMCTKGYGTINTEMIACTRDQNYTVFLHLYKHKDKYSKGIALLEAAKSKNYELTYNLFIKNVYKKAVDIHGNTFLHYITGWKIIGKRRAMIVSEIIHQSPTYIFYIKNNKGETANLLMSKIKGLNQTRLEVLQSRNTICKKYENITYQLLPPTYIQKEKIYHWNNPEEQLSVQIQRGYNNNKDLSNKWCAILTSFKKTNNPSRIFKHAQGHSCIHKQHIVCCYNENYEQLEIVYVYTSNCTNKYDYDNCSCIQGICTKAVGYTLYALKDYIIKQNIGDITSGEVYIYSDKPCNAFNCYNRAFILNGFRMYKPYQSFENFLKKLKKWQKQKVKTHGFDFTMYYVV